MKTKQYVIIGIVVFITLVIFSVAQNYNAKKNLGAPAKEREEKAS